MAEFVFLGRSPKEIEIFGGEVFFDIDGKNIGKLSLESQSIQVSPGTHTIKMYKSHTYDTFIGFAETTIELHDGDQLMVKYACPMMINQPGNIVVSDYNEQKEKDAICQREVAIQRDFIEQENQKRIAEEKYRNGVWIMIAIAVVIGIFYGLEMASIY